VARGGLAASISLAAAAVRADSVAVSPHAEVGRPFVRQFAPGANRIGFLVQTIQQDPLGFVHISERLAHRVFDGFEWARLDHPPESAGARSAVRTADGTIYWGGAGLVARLEGAGRSSTIVSLADRLPPSRLGCDDLHAALAVGNDVWFADEEKILRWSGGKFDLIPFPSPPRSRGPRLHHVGGSVYATVPGQPLRRVAVDGIHAVSDDPVFSGGEIVLLEAEGDAAMLVLSARQGFYRFAGGRCTPVAIEANRWLAGRTIWRARRLHDGSLAVIFGAASGDGGMRFDPAGRYVGPLDQSTGLYLRELRDLFEDGEGGLWLGSEVGLFRLEWPSPVSLFDLANGFGVAPVSGLVRHAGELYVADAEGVFRLQRATADGRSARFEREMRQSVFSLLSHAGGLLALGPEGLWTRTPSGWVRAVELPPAVDGLLLAAPGSDRAWVATSAGLRSVRPMANGWVEDAPRMDFERPARRLRRLEDGSLLVEPESGPAYRLDLSGAGGVVTRTPLSAGAESWLGEEAQAVSSAAAGARWVATADRVVELAADGRELRRLPNLVVRGAGRVSFVQEERSPAGDVLWLGAERGLMRVDLAAGFRARPPFPVALTAAGVREGEMLPVEHDSLRFDFVALRHQFADAVSYQTRLVGHEDVWSAWTTDQSRQFLRLAPGSYRFEVRARDADGVTARPAVLAFSVAVPWWRSIWALVGYVVVAGGGVVGVVHLRTRALRRHNAFLSALVAERTRELAVQNEELVRLHRIERDGRIAARLAEEKARLEVLRYQLNPHFLFNTMAAISAALPAEARNARAMVERLADFCRLTLHRDDDHEWTTLGRELELLRAYLDIERGRWGDLLGVEVDCDPALAGTALPHFLLLPLVENALKYGRATSPDRVGIRLAVARDPADGALVITVANTGTWVESAVPRGIATLGIGLENIRSRLEHHYPRAHTFAIDARDGWVVVRLRLHAPAPAV
jgi:hypothetical protein